MAAVRQNGTGTIIEFCGIKMTVHDKKFSQVVALIVLVFLTIITLTASGYVIPKFTGKSNIDQTIKKINETGSDSFKEFRIKAEQKFERVEKNESVINVVQENISEIKTDIATINGKLDMLLQLQRNK